MRKDFAFHLQQIDKLMNATVKIPSDIRDFFREEDSGRYHFIERISDSGRDDLIFTINELSRLPVHESQLLHVLSDSGVRSREIESIISREAGLNGKILDLVNSPFFNIPQKVYDLKQALELLGTDEFGTLIFVSSLYFRSSEYPGPLDLDSMWRHSLGVSRLVS